MKPDPRISEVPAMSLKTLSPRLCQLGFFTPSACLPFLCQLFFCQPLSFQPLSFQPLSFQPLSCQPLSFQPLSCQPLSCQPLSCQPLSCQPLSCQPLACCDSQVWASRAVQVFGCWARGLGLLRFQNFARWLSRSRAKRHFTFGVWVLGAPATLQFPRLCIVPRFIDR